MLDQDSAHDALATLEDTELAAQDRFDRVVRLARQLFDVPIAYVALLDRPRDRLVYRAESGLGISEARAQGAFCSTTIAQGRMLVIPDTAQDELFATSPLVTDHGIRFYAGVPLRAPSGERVATLCVVDHRPHAFGPRDEALLQDLADWVEKELATDADLERAGQVQAGLLPRQSPEVPGYDVAAACVPARVVGGDFYDWHRVRAGVAITLADVMGKGLSAALIASSLRAVLRTSTRRLGAVDALSDAEEALAEDLEAAGSFATVFHAVLDADTGVVTYADAGHGLGLVVRTDGTHERLQPGGPPFGFAALGARSPGEVALGPGDLLVSVSDGVLDAFGGSLAALEVVREAVAGATSARDVVDRVVTLTTRRLPLVDDVTVVALHRGA